MKDVLSLVTLAIATLCLPMFVAMAKPLSAVLAPSNIVASPSGMRLQVAGPYITGRSSSRSISELPSCTSSDPTIEPKLET